ncbi:MAG: hypothetical protein V2A56_04350 [bacterium]
MKAKTFHFTGIAAFLVILFSMPVGHAVMILIEKVFGPSYMYPGAGALGLGGALMVLWGARAKGELKATWLGYFGGILVWTGWVEFAFVFQARHLGIPPQMVDGEVATKPEYLLMPSSLGLLLAAMLYFLFNPETRCNFFTWLQRNLRLGIERESAPAGRNYSIVTFMETTFVLWFFYILLLLVYDERLFGDDHPATFVVFAGSLVWSLYLFTRLLKFRRMAPAVRYGIPTVVIFWNTVEILGRWGFFREVWIEPQRYALEMILILASFVAAGVLAHRMQ